MKSLQTDSKLSYVRDFGCYLRTALSMAEAEAKLELTRDQIDEIAEELRRTDRIDAQCAMFAEDSFFAAFSLAFSALGAVGITGNQTGMISLKGGLTTIATWGGAAGWHHSALCSPARDGSGDHWTHGDALLQQVWDPYPGFAQRSGVYRATLYTFWRQ